MLVSGTVKAEEATNENETGPTLSKRRPRPQTESEVHRRILSSKQIAERVPMTISKRVQQELQQVAPDASAPLTTEQSLLDTSTTRAARARREALAAQTKGQAWTKDEHARFLVAVAKYPSGPWEAIAEHVGTKNARQTMTHAQKCRQKNERRARGLRAAVRRKKTPSESGSVAAVVDADGDMPMTECASPARPALTKQDSVESPRSGEEECDPSPDLELELELELQLDVDRRALDDALVQELFDQYPNPLSLQSMWSTSSFPDALPVEVSDLDDLTLTFNSVPDDAMLQWAI